MGPSDPPAPPSDPDPPVDFVQREELGQVLVEMLDDEIRHLKMRLGILTARREKVVRKLHLN